VHALLARPEVPTARAVINGNARKTGFARFVHLVAEEATFVPVVTFRETLPEALVEELAVRALLFVAAQP